jgi:hypothetical protein
MMHQVGGGCPAAKRSSRKRFTGLRANCGVRRNKVVAVCVECACREPL